MAAKCNITTFALQKLNKIVWGIDCPNEADKAIIENYIEYINCDCVVISPCYEGKDCTSTNIVDFNCDINIVSVSFKLTSNNNPADIIFLLSITDIYGATGNLIYSWQYDSATFELVGSATDAQLKLKLRPGKLLATLVSPITVSVTDENNCSDNFTAYYTPTGMKIGNFVPCSNPKTLIVSSTYDLCGKPKKLTVH